MKVLLATALLAVLATVAHAADPVRSTVKVVCYRGDITENGSGTVVYSSGGKSLVLTNRHVCPDADCEIDVYSKGNIYEGRWLGVADRGDLAVLEIGVELPAAPLAERPPANGDRLDRWGYPNGRRQKAKQGRFSFDVGFDDRYGRARMDSVSVPSVKGESGSGEFNERGELVAVVFGGNNESLCVGLEDVRRCVRKFTR
jgi:hypothetical protein